ncbi:hypothetical protein, partial [Streptomyces sp. NPDC056948]|uniref:hypothetical protein n=1 Tax=Streptomyces sp. NPDC056948 TaxID=3345975 RepID=UPI0036440031
RPNDRRRDDDRRRDTDKDRPRRRPLRRARQTIKSAVRRARRAADKLFGKSRRRIGNRVNDRLRKLRDQWRRRNERVKNRAGDRDRRRERESEQEKDPTRQYNMPRVHFRARDGEAHTLMYQGRGRGADLVVRSDPRQIRRYLDSWEADIEPIKDTSQGRMQDALHHQAEGALREVNAGQRGLPVRVTNANYQQALAARDRLHDELKRLATLLEYRESDEPKPPLLPTIIPEFQDGIRARGFEATGINKKIPRGQVSTLARPGNPIGWDTLPSTDTTWVRMHLLTERLAGPAKGSNLVPAPGSEVNTKFHYRLEGPAHRAVAVNKTEDMIWYQVAVAFHSDDRTNSDYGYPKSIGMKWGGYEPKGKRWVRKPTEMSYERDNVEKPGRYTHFNINGRSPAKMVREFKVTPVFAKAVVLQGPYRDFVSLRLRMTKYKRKLPAGQLTSFQADLAKLAARQNELRYN